MVPPRHLPGRPRGLSCSHGSPRPRPQQRVRWSPGPLRPQHLRGDHGDPSGSWVAPAAAATGNNGDAAGSRSVPAGSCRFLIRKWEGLGDTRRHGGTSRNKGAFPIPPWEEKSEGGGGRSPGNENLHFSKARDEGDGSFEKKPMLISMRLNTQMSDGEVAGKSRMLKFRVLFVRKET